MQNHTTTETVAFYYNESLYALHPDESVEVSYLGEAEITTSQLPASDGGGSLVSVELKRLWMGVDVPENWENRHYRAIAVPNGEQKFYNLIKDLELAALDAAESTTVVRLPENLIQVEMHDTVNGQAVTVFHEIAITI